MDDNHTRPYFQPTSPFHSQYNPEMDSKLQNKFYNIYMQAS